MELSDALKASLPGLYDIPLRPVLFRTEVAGAGSGGGDGGGEGGDKEEEGRPGVVVVAEADASRTLKDVAVSQAGSVGSIAFVVRRPG